MTEEEIPAAVIDTLADLLHAYREERQQQGKRFSFADFMQWFLDEAGEDPELDAPTIIAE